MRIDGGRVRADSVWSVGSLQNMSGRYVLSVFIHNNGNRKHAADHLQIGIRTLERWLVTLGVDGSRVDRRQYPLPLRRERAHRQTKSQYYEEISAGQCLYELEHGILGVS